MELHGQVNGKDDPEAALYELRVSGLTVATESADK